jgi:hypothetical protein
VGPSRITKLTDPATEEWTLELGMHANCTTADLYDLEMLSVALARCDPDTLVVRISLGQGQRDFGAGKPIGHWGGRLIWQLPNIDALLVAWKETPGRVPVEVEAELIEQFRLTYGKPPFANDPHRLGL